MNEVKFNELIEGRNYLIQDSSRGDEGRRPIWSHGSQSSPYGDEISLRAKGIKYLGPENFSFEKHTKVEQYLGFPATRQAKEGTNFGNIEISQLSEGDPLVRFESIEPLNKKSCAICHVTHLKPFDEGQNPGIGYKFYETKEILIARLLFHILPNELGQDAKRQIITEITRDPAAAAEVVQEAYAKDMNGGYKNNLKNKKKKKYNRNKATMKTKQKKKRKTRTKKIKK